MKITKQARREAKALFESCQVNKALDEGRTREVLRQVLERRPRGYFAILSHFQRLVKLHLERRTAKVESAAALESGFKDALQSKLSSVYGSGLIVSFEQKPALIGGLRIQVGSDVYDGSVRARLDALVERL